MAIHVYNTLTREKEEFKPLNPPEVKMYTCGVTVYDECHLGHMRSLYIFEVIRRYLKYKGFDVQFIRNITDVDDKIIDKARKWSQEKGISLEEAFDLVRETYIKSYYQDLKTLNIPSADEEPKATENIEDMSIFFQKLRDKGFAYESGGNVYFSVRKFPSYGKLSGEKIDDLRSAVRIEADPLKKDPLDFALWKSKKEDEPFWESGKTAVDDGRPGWHIECSTMAQKYLGETLDIHGGGKDLIFPHHENEIAQSEAITGKTFARYWIHHGLLTINGQKMAKSLGNFIRLADVLEKSDDKELAINALKLFFLSACYANPLDFTWEKLDEATKQAKKIEGFFERESSLNIENKNNILQPEDKISKIKEKFIIVMDDDFNTPEGLACMFELVDLGNQFVAQGDKSGVSCVKSELEELLDIFALGFRLKGAKELISRVDVLNQEVDSLIKQRDSTRKRGDFRQADEIRKRLEQKGIILEDTKAGTIWRRK